MLRLEPRTLKAIALIAAFPLLVAFQIILIVLGAPGRTLASVGAVAWFVGPALAVAGVVMLWQRRQWGVAPSTREGRASMWLFVGCVALFLLFWVMLALGAGPDNPETFLSNLYLAIPLMLAGGCAIVGGVLGAYALVARKERSLLVVGILVVGAVVALFTAGEIGGHDEPESTAGRRATPATSPTDPGASRTPTSTTQPSPVATTAPNSHANVTIVDLGPGQVRVSFDYAYNQDRPGTTITAITVTPLNAARAPLPGYEPEVRSISRGSGHMDVTMTFSAERLALVRGFSVCFTGTNAPDLGCAVKEYVP